MKNQIANVFSELGKGSLQAQLAEALKEVSTKVSEHGKHGKEGEIIITLKFIPAKEGEQIYISSKVLKKVPTETGHKAELFRHETAFFLDKDLNLCASVPEENDGGQLNIV